MSNGQDCTCNAWSAYECACGADWTPQEVYDLRDENNRLKAELAEQARIVGMGAERELALLAKAERLEKELAEQGERIAELKKECERFRQEALDSYLDDEESVITKQALEITRLKVELAEAKKDAERWKYARRKICFTGNGDGTCMMHGINLPAAIPGWPDPGKVAEFCDAAIDAAMKGK